MNIIKFNFPNNILDSRGGILTEFALIATLIIPISLSTFDISHSFSTTQIVSNISREAANFAYQKCSFETEITGISDCLEETYEELVNTKLSSIVAEQDVNVVLSIYRKEGVNTTRVQWPTDIDSPFDKKNLVSKKVYQDVLDGLGVMVLSEVISKPTSAKSFLKFNKKYEATIY